LKTYLCLDIGGTNTRIASIQRVEENISKLTRELENNVQSFKNENFKKLENLIHSYFHDKKNEELNNTYVIICAAGHINNNSIKLTNFNWEINPDKLSEEFNFKSVTLLNDLEAASYFVNYQLTSSKIEFKNAAVIGIGTGLGLSKIIKKSSEMIIIPTEAGHNIIAGKTNITQKAIEFIKKQISKQFIEYEEFLSGSGIILLNKYINYIYGDKNTGITSEEIILEALKGKKSNIYTLELFIAILIEFIEQITYNSLIDTIVFTGSIMKSLRQIFENIYKNYENKSISGYRVILEYPKVHFVDDIFSNIKGCLLIALNMYN
jgi:glucokinase